MFWLSGSAAWASGVSSVKYVSNPDNFASALEICKSNNNTCTTDFAGNFAGLNISIVRAFSKFYIFPLLFNYHFLNRFSDSWIFSCGQSISGSSIKRLHGFKILLLLAASQDCHLQHRGTAIGHSGCGRVQPAVFVKKK